MSKQKSSISKIKVIILIISIILISLFAAAIVLSIPIMLCYILGLVLSSKEGYLLTGLSFCIFGGIIIIVVPIIIFILISNKSNRINDIKKCFKKCTVFSIVIISIIVMLEIIVGYRGYTYYKDIVEGPQEAIMMDATVKYRRHNSHVIGYINGKKIDLKLTQDAHSKVSRNKSYKMIKIKYYKNIKEVYYIDVYISYKDDK